MNGRQEWVLQFRCRLATAADGVLSPTPGGASLPPTHGHLQVPPDLLEELAWMAKECSGEVPCTVEVRFGGEEPGRGAVTGLNWEAPPGERAEAGRDNRGKPVAFFEVESPGGRLQLIVEEVPAGPANTGNAPAAPIPAVPEPEEPPVPALGRIDAILVGLDGAVIDSEEDWFRAWSRYVARQGGTWTEQDQGAVLGTATLEWARYIRDTYGIDKAANVIVDEVLGLLVQRYYARIPALLGVRRILRALADRYPLALVSSSPHSIIDYVVARLGLQTLFEKRVSADELAPEDGAGSVHLLACRRLRVAPETALAVEGYPRGIQSAKAAGIRVIAVPPAHLTPEELGPVPPDLVLESLNELTPRLLDRLGRTSR